MIWHQNLFERWEDFIPAYNGGGYEGERNMTENSPDGVVDQRIYRDFRFTIYLTKKIENQLIYLLEQIQELSLGII